MSINSQLITLEKRSTNVSSRVGFGLVVQVLDHAAPAAHAALSDHVPHTAVTPAALAALSHTSV